jgi:hypothetical protein
MIQQNAGAPPAPLLVRNVLSDLLGRDVTVAAADPVLTADLPTTTVAAYVDTSLRLSAVIGLDLSLAAVTGAALGLLPPAGADIAIEEGFLSAALADNVREVCNVLSGILNRLSPIHHRLHQVYLPGEDVPSDVAARLLALGARLDLRVDVHRYGAGRFSVSLAA